MKKFLLGFVALIGLAVASPKAEAQTFVKGDNIVDAKIGLGSSFDFSGLPPMGVNYEHGLANDIFNNGSNVNFGLGAEVDFWGQSNKISDVKYSWFYSFIGARGAFHKEFVNNLDTYLGVSLGVSIGRSSMSSVNVSSSSTAKSFGYSTFLGCRYYFNPNWAVNAEIGYGISVLSLGVTYKF